MYKIMIECLGVAPDSGPQAAIDIEQEFRIHRTWHERPSCTYANGKLLLIARNDFDADGMALLDEFWDCLAAYLGEHGPMHILGVEQV
ncbi:hypothetical protein [Mesorhizobium sp.]|uniref:hypothetical protein n=1 Tax=Mesorhizobium sp. TaxID=1871066 RepID=UPI000FE78628|nr:hypothetical protein [Mesorhizobium sp.]RWK41628.1 MAG: hypothetical protein EOR46_15100 [Mesorhizobium sp.]RWK71152.1 MAG: hypothetical protein EOR54_03300 [Mesorhizobium sp.]RWK75996.1 MAG: hypothetical protein EOR50_15185 [Mesorhizobium sp.]RWK84365.1 MAG: hypothetical protein EOR51_01820 [Mesorhizobium sp.]RWL04977.1 MAG: hypothetical protein EOR55_13605 [Mesorhizobium sp.]